MFDSITGVILAGGKSSRMGADKSRIDFRGKPMIHAPRDVLCGLFSSVIVSVRETGSFPDLALPEIADRYPDTGPLGGITTVLESVQAPVFCVACDMPFLNADLIRYLCETRQADAVVPVWQGRPEVLHAWYSPALLPQFRKALSENRLKLIDALIEANVFFVPDEVICRFVPDGACFRNINTPEEYNEIL
jgi:molybdopterin-guanine dinucleotide biosynthesis protein A